MAWRFDQKGNMVGQPVDLRNRLDLHIGIPAPTGAIREVLARSSQPQRVAVDPSEQQWKYGSNPPSE